MEKKGIALQDLYQWLLGILLQGICINENLPVIKNLTTLESDTQEMQIRISAFDFLVLLQRMKADRQSIT